MRTESLSPRLSHDGFFWLALITGIVVSFLLQLVQSDQPGHTWDIGQWRQLAWLVVLYPVAEEWLFRGVVQKKLLSWQQARRQYVGFSLANLITSLLFAFAHLFNHNLLWAGLVFFPSMIFGWFRDRYRNFFPAVLLHTGYNAAYFFLLGLPA